MSFTSARKPCRAASIAQGEAHVEFELLLAAGRGLPPRRRAAWPRARSRRRARALLRAESGLRGGVQKVHAQQHRRLYHNNRADTGRETILVVETNTCSRYWCSGVFGRA